jgi:hypothetical protein
MRLARDVPRVGGLHVRVAPASSYLIDLINGWLRTKVLDGKQF